MLGIIGGLGPMATAYFMELITQMTDAATDQEHIEMIVMSRPQTPDRTAYILGKSEETPLDDMADMGRFLTDAGAQFLAIPCITAHYFHDELESRVGNSVAHIIRETGQYLRERGVKTVGIMATDGTIGSGLFTKGFKEYGIETVVPDDKHQAMVMKLIYDDIKAGKPPRLELFNEVASHLKEQGAAVIILGCTELSMIKKDYPLPAGVLDAMEVLASAVVKKCGKLKEEYTELITS